MTIRYRILLVVALFAGTAVVPACYTIIYHPRLANLDYGRPESQQCADCHTSDEIWSYNHSPSAPTYRNYNGAWTDYYDTAWWYYRYWSYTPHSDSGFNPDGRETSIAIFNKRNQGAFDRTEQTARPHNAGARCQKEK